MSGRRLLAAAIAGTVAGLGLAVVPSAVAATLPAGCVLGSDAVTVTCSYAYTGAEQTFEVPPAVTSLHVLVIGAAGGAAQVRAPSQSRSFWGLGAYVTGTVSTTPGSLLYIEVGGTSRGGPSCSGLTLCLGGFNGGGDSSSQGGGGGGASDIRTISSSAPESLASRIVVAGGGGGDGAASSSYGGGPADRPGTDTHYVSQGPYSATVSASATGGRAGTSSAGGAGGAASADPTPAPAPYVGTAELDPGSGGGLGQGGDAASSDYPGGGGGGGVWGGGAGASADYVTSDPNAQSAGPSAVASGGGGGGSSLLPPDAPSYAEWTMAEASVSLSYHLQTQSISVSPTPPLVGVIGQTYAIAAHGGPSGEPVIWRDVSQVPGTCTVTPAGVVSFLAVGACQLVADEASDGAEFLPAIEYRLNFIVEDHGGTAADPTVQLKAAPKRTHLGGQVRLTGASRPAAPGAREILMVRSDGIWGPIARTHATASGFHFTVRARRRGATMYRVMQYATTTVAPGVSSVVTVTVR